MNKTILFFIALSWVLVGCASQPPSNGAMFGETGTLSVSGCTSYASTASCSGDKNNPKVIFDLDNFKVLPECVNAKKGTTIEIFIVSTKPPVEGSVIVFPKKPENYFWLAKSNKPNKNKIKIKVKDKKPSGEPLPPVIYEYGIWTKDKCIDPRVKVEN